MIAMAGKNCVAIATDTRLSTQLMTIDSNFQRVFKVNEKCLMGISGLATDCQTLYVHHISIASYHFLCLATPG